MVAVSADDVAMSVLALSENGFAGFVALCGVDVVEVRGESSIGSRLMVDKDATEVGSPAA